MSLLRVIALNLTIYFHVYRANIMVSKRQTELKKELQDSYKKAEKLIDRDEEPTDKGMQSNMNEKEVVEVTGTEPKENFTDAGYRYDSNVPSQQNDIAGRGRYTSKTKSQFSDVALTDESRNQAPAAMQGGAENSNTNVKGETSSSTNKKEGGLISAIASMIGGNKVGEKQQKESDTLYQNKESATGNHGKRSMVANTSSPNEENQYYEGTELKSGARTGREGTIHNNEKTAPEQYSSKERMQANRVPDSSRDPNPRQEELKFSNEGDGTREGDSIKMKILSQKQAAQPNLADNGGHRRNTTIESEATMIQENNTQMTKKEKRKGEGILPSKGERRILDPETTRGTIYQEIHGDHLEAAEPRYTNELSEAILMKRRKGEMIRKQRLKGIPRSDKLSTSGNQGETRQMRKRTGRQADNEQLTAEENLMAKQSAKAAIRKNEAAA